MGLSSRPHSGDDIPEGSASHICFFISVSLACFLPRGTRSLKSQGSLLPSTCLPQLVVRGPGEGGETHLVLLLQACSPRGPPQTFLFPGHPSNPQPVHCRLTPQSTPCPLPSPAWPPRVTGHMGGSALPAGMLSHSAHPHRGTWRNTRNGLRPIYCSSSPQEYEVSQPHYLPPPGGPQMPNLTSPASRFP